MHFVQYHYISYESTNINCEVDTFVKEPTD
jgi:hypothetical protein